MKKNIYLKLLKLASPILIVASMTTVVSCGHKNSSGGNGWNTFKALALKETAKNLKTQISDVTNFYWTTSDVAIFSGNGHPKVTKYDQEVIATIVIQDQASADSYPINFKIDYTAGSPYVVSDWSYSQASEINDYDHFKASATAETGTTLLAKAKLAQNWASLKWYGTNVWKASDQAEFDVFGGNGGDDTYKGMAGNVTFDDDAQSATAIISVKGKEGIYGAMPIKATITYNSKISYNANSWVFSQITQLQSQKKYVAVMNVQNNTVYSKMTDSTHVQDSVWTNFLNNNWLDEKHTQTIDSNWKKSKGFQTGDWVKNSASYIPGDVLPNNSGFKAKIIFAVRTENGDPVGSYIIQRDFNYLKDVDSKYIPVGNCFDFSWLSASF